MKERKAFKFDVKEVTDEGRFTGYLSVFGNVDRGGDIVMQGAFSKSLTEQSVFPLLWSHNSDTPLGVFSGKEDNYGLLIEGQLDMNVQAAREKHSLMKMKAIRGLSIGYETLKEEWTRNIRMLKELKLWEGSLCVFPMNELAQVTAVKNGDVEGLLTALVNMPEELKPYPNEHAARLVDPEKFDEFRRKGDGKLWNKVDVPASVMQIWGHLKGQDENAWATQALRFPVKDWTEEAARKWLKDNDVKPLSFEPASDKMADTIKKAIDSLTALAQGAEPQGRTPQEPQGEPQIAGKVDAIIGEVKSFLEHLTQGD